MKKQAAGFTLIEVMIAMVIIGILAAVAIPSYTSAVRKGARADAKSQMMNIAQMEERYFSNSAGSTTAGAYTTLPAAPATPVPAGWQNWSGGSTAGAGKYAISVALASSPAYTITATTFNNWSDPTCTTLILDSDGTKTSKDSGGTLSTGCW